MYIVEILSGLLTPVIAVTTVYIAYQQYLINRRRLNHELYDRRLKVYQNISRFISSVLQKSKIEINELLDFYSKCAEASFLFNKDIPDYVEDIWNKGRSLLEILDKLDGDNKLPVGEERSKAAAERSDLLGWFHKEGEGLKSKFRPYLSPLK